MGSNVLAPFPLTVGDEFGRFETKIWPCYKSQSVLPGAWPHNVPCVPVLPQWTSFNRKDP